MFKSAPKALTLNLQYGYLSRNKLAAARIFFSQGIPLRIKVSFNKFHSLFSAFCPAGVRPRGCAHLLRHAACALNLLTQPPSQLWSWLLYILFSVYCTEISLCSCKFRPFCKKIYLLYAVMLQY